MDVGFEKIAPYLKEPLILIGFFLLLAFSFSRYLVKQRVIPPLPKALGYRILRSILLYGFIIGLLLIILGFALKRQELTNQQRTLERIELMLRDALNHAPGLSEEKRSEIIREFVEGYRSGALSEDQVESKLEEINATLMGAYGKPLPAGLRPNQTYSVGGIKAKINDSPETAQTPQIVNNNPSLAAESSDAYRIITSNPLRVSSDEERGRRSEAEMSSRVVVSPSTTSALKCVVKIVEPAEWTQVHGSLIVRGTASIPAGGHLWVFEGDGANWTLYYNGNRPDIEDGKWETSVSVEGRTGTYEIAAVVIGEQEETKLRQAFDGEEPATIWTPDMTAVVFHPKSIRLPTSLTGCSVAKVKVVRS